jgi:hypothetical protein
MAPCNPIWLPACGVDSTNTGGKGVFGTMANAFVGVGASVGCAEFPPQLLANNITTTIKPNVNRLERCRIMITSP